VVSLALCGFAPAASGNDQPEAPKRLIVKVRSSVANDVEAALPMSNMSLTPQQPGSPTVEAFFQRHRARRMSPCYSELELIRIPDIPGSGTRATVVK
jgi:hypothetical protein